MADSRHTLPGSVREVAAGQACLACLADGGTWSAEADWAIYAFYREDGSMITALCGRHLAHHALPMILSWDLMPKAGE